MPEPKQIFRVKFDILQPAIPPPHWIQGVINVCDVDTGRTIKASIRGQVKELKYYPKLLDKITLRVGEKKADAKVLEDDKIITTAVLHLSEPIMFWVESLGEALRSPATHPRNHDNTTRRLRYILDIGSRPRFWDWVGIC
ncbi:hypothetical protein DFP72DRAFT_851213 [Ephemerocybe angulata]|uniref:Uncharacterized protein n=1 Tax=Ephemerocybe angulata TaxID=980116 RepID=A0A8H6HPR7_9AGAR|nr:hypothetical protein DFP72DRAFT_851213 [Tulosesus angulatus]